MVNYKPNISTIEIAGFQRAIGNSKGILLQNLTKSTVGNSAHNIEDDTNYQVPTGKKFYLVGIIISAHTSVRIMKIYQSDDVDASTNPVNKFLNYTTVAVGETIPLPYTPSFEAGKYINVQINNTSGGPLIKFLFGFEQ